MRGGDGDSFRPPIALSKSISGTLELRLPFDNFSSGRSFRTDHLAVATFQLQQCRYEWKEIGGAGIDSRHACQQQQR